jgi:hypothetical protein
VQTLGFELGKMKRSIGVRTHFPFFTAGGVCGFTFWKLQARCRGVSIRGDGRAADVAATRTMRLMNPL